MKEVFFENVRCKMVSVVLLQMYQLDSFPVHVHGAYYLRTV